MKRLKRFHNSLIVEMYVMIMLLWKNQLRQLFFNFKTFMKLNELSSFYENIKHWMYFNMFLI